MESMRQYVKDEFGNPGANGGYGAGLKKDIRRFYGATIGMSGRGESVPQYNNYCDIDPSTVDKFGIPVLRFNYKWRSEEHTSELQSRENLVCRLLLEKKTLKDNADEEHKESQ